MTSRIATVSCVVAGALSLAAVSACGKSPTEPFDGVKKLEVSGPTTAAPGQSLRYIATAHYVDGSTRDVTAEVTWRGNGPMTFTSPGVATSPVNGEWDVTAIFHVFTVSVHVIVLEPGTFKLTGTIREQGGGTLPFGGKVVVLSGVGQGKQSSASVGPYLFYGVAGPLRLEVSSTGYFTTVHDIDVTGHTVQNFELAPLETPVDVAGDWTLTLGPPPPGCPAGLPGLAETRSYNLAVMQKGRILNLRLRGPTLQVADDSYTGGTVSGQRVSLGFSNPENDFGEDLSINLLDRLSATETFSFKGQLNFQGNESPIATTMNGMFRYWSRPVTLAPSWECKTTSYPVTLRR